MACLKCGKKTEGEQVFCPACLTVMEAHPVKKDVHIQLPNRKERALPKRTGRKRRALSAEEQLPLLKKRQNRLIALIVLLALLLGAAVGLLIFTLTAPEELKSEWGSNYSIQLPEN